ncbi:MAG TPA: autotransporter-associated beta strand repeat-containing protein, partial [Prosthecobacter sp.]
FKHREFTRVQNVALRTDDAGRVQLGKLAGIETVTSRAPNGRTGSWTLEESDQTFTSTIHLKEGEDALVPISNSKAGPVSLLAMAAGTFTAELSAQMKQANGLLTVSALKPGSYSMRIPHEDRMIRIEVAAGDAVAGWVMGKHRQLEIKGGAPLAINSVESDAEFITVKLTNSSPFARVHVAASRFEPGAGILGGLGGFMRFGAAAGTPDRLPNLYSAGREIGDEYRYILERRYAKLFPGNMLKRPGLLLNPWETRKTDLEELNQQAGEGAGMTRGGSAGSVMPATAMAPKRKAPAPGPQGGTNLDFLAVTAPTIYNLLPDKDGTVRIERKALGDRQHVQIYAEDLQNASWRTLTLPEVPTKFADQRLARTLDPVKPFTQKKEVTFLEAGKTLKLADILTSELETYDTLGSVHSLLQTLNGEPNIALFRFVVEWPKLSEDEKRAKYSEHACHELSFFLYRKDKPFFDKVIKPYLANKKDKTFMDEFLLGMDLKQHLEPWAYGQLNIVERILLAQRIEGEEANAARHVRELWEVIPPNPEHADHLFETALRGRSMEAAAGGVGGALATAQSEIALSPPPPPMAPAPAPMMAPAAAAPADNFAEEPKANMNMMKRAVPGAPASRGRLMASVDEMAFEERELTLQKSGSGAFQIAGSNIYTGATTLSGGTLAYFGKDTMADARREVRILFRALGPTKEWAENNYYKLRIVDQDADLVTVNAFWRDYAAWVAAGSKGAFVSPHIAEASSNFTEMMLALGALDLPFEAAKHVTKAENGQFTLTAGGPLIVYHKEIKPAVTDAEAQGQLLVSQSFFRQGDRYRQEGNEKFEKYVVEEFLTGVTYGANIVVTNPTSSPVKAVVLLQIPQGALPVLGSKATNSRQIRLEPYTTQTFEYHFYFPITPAKADLKFAHFPVNVATSTTAAGAKPFEFNVVSKLTQVDKASWHYISQYGTEAEVFTFLEQNNLETLEMERIAWRCRQSVDFYKRLVAFMNQHHVPDESIFSYALLHNDTATLREWLKFHEEFVSTCGPFLESKLIKLDPIERRGYEHLEYSPL